MELRQDTFNCSGRKNDTHFREGGGWEGIPFNVALNTSFFLIFTIAFAILRKIAWAKKSGEENYIRYGWLEFIYGDRKSALRPPFKPRKSEVHHHNLNEHLLVPPPSELATLLPHKKHHNDPCQASINGSNSATTATGAATGAVAGAPVVTPASTSQPGEIEVIIEDASKSTVRNRHENTFATETENATDHTAGDTRLVEDDARPHRSLSIDSVTQMGRRLLDVIAIKDEDILKHRGVDALQYLSFQRYIIYFLILLALICLFIILPINTQGTIKSDKEMYARTTINNIDSSSNLLWAHATIAWMLFPIGIYLMYRFSTSVRAQHEQFARRTLFIRRIPRSLVKRDNLMAWFASQFPEVTIEGIQQVYEIKKLKVVHSEYLNLTNAVKYCESYQEHYNEDLNIRPYFLGHTFGICCCNQCPQTDGFIYYREKAEEVERKLENLFKETVDNPVGSVFVTFRTEKMAQTVYKSLCQSQDQSCSCLPCCTWGSWLLSHWRNTDRMRTYRWQVSYAPNPEDVNWDDISTALSMIWLRRILINTLLFVVFLFLTTPPIVINLIQDLHNSVLDEWVSVNFPNLTKYLSTLLLIIMSNLLPSIVTLASAYLPYKTISEMNHSIMWKSYFFLILMVLVLPSLGFTTAAEIIKAITAANPKFDWQCLFPVDDGAFFINYVLQAALIAAEYENSRQRILFDFYFGTRYARFLLIFCMVVSYSITCPLIAPCGLLYMCLKHLVDKYNIYYVYTPTKISNQIHSTAIMFFHIAIGMMQFQVFTFFYLRTGTSDVTAFTIISVIITTIFFLGHSFFNCFRNINHLTYSAAAGREAKKIDKTEFCACLYLPPLLMELNETTTSTPSGLRWYGSIKSKNKNSAKSETIIESNTDANDTADKGASV